MELTSTLFTRIGSSSSPNFKIILLVTVDNQVTIGGFDLDFYGLLNFTMFKILSHSLLSTISSSILPSFIFYSSFFTLPFFNLYFSILPSFFFLLLNAFFLLFFFFLLYSFWLILCLHL